MAKIGVTTEGLSVQANIFPLVGTHGVPLEYVLHHFKDNGMVMDWPDYIKGALKDGHKPRTIKARILAAVGDVYGPEYRKQVEIRLNKVIR